MYYNAKDSNGNIVHILDAQKGSDYFCLGCGSRLTPKRGDIRTFHFAHLANEACHFSDETHLHREAKAFFEQEKSITVQINDKVTCIKAHNVAVEQYFYLTDRAKCDTCNDDTVKTKFKPDIAFLGVNNEPILFIEICVTNKLTPKRKANYYTFGVDTIEIFLDKKNNETVPQQLLNFNNQKWIYYEKLGIGYGYSYATTRISGSDKELRQSNIGFADVCKGEIEAIYEAIERYTATQEFERRVEDALSRRERTDREVRNIEDAIRVVEQEIRNIETTICNKARQLDNGYISRIPYTENVMDYDDEDILRLCTIEKEQSAGIIEQIENTERNINSTIRELVSRNKVILSNRDGKDIGRTLQQYETEIRKQFSVVFEERETNLRRGILEKANTFYELANKSGQDDIKDALKKYIEFVKNFDYKKYRNIIYSENDKIDIKKQ